VGFSIWFVNIYTVIVSTVSCNKGDNYSFVMNIQYTVIQRVWFLIVYKRNKFYTNVEAKLVVCFLVIKFRRKQLYNFR
jgi:hypothetical protein